MNDVVVVGSYIQDLAFETPFFPAPGETRIGRFRTGQGGKGFNQAVACHRQGVKTLFIGAVGRDLFAEDLRKFVEREGIETRLQVCPDAMTGAASIVINEAGENLIVVALGASDALSPDFIEGHRADIEGAKVLITQVECNLAATRRALEIARGVNTTAILNPAPIHHGLTKELLELADVILPNETEFVHLTRHVYGGEIADDFWLADDRKIHELCNRVNVPTVVLTLGDKGCFVSHNGAVKRRACAPADGGDRFYRVPALKVKTVDTTGAGDAFSGGLAAGLLCFPRDCRNAIRFANFVGALSTQAHGTAPAMPRRKDVEKFL